MRQGSVCRRAPQRIRAAGAEALRGEQGVDCMTDFLDTLKYNDAGLVTVIVQVKGRDVLVRMLPEESAWQCARQSSGT